jgi:beta-mannosidase
MRAVIQFAALNPVKNTIAMEKFMLSKSLSGSWQLRQVGESQTYPGQVPGGVHTDLLAAGCIPDPFVGDNELGVQWVAEKNWQYSRTFDVSKELLSEERVYLVGDGLDTLGKVEINGNPVGSFQNMFVQYRWDVKSQLKEGENSIVFTFDSPVQYAREHEEKFPLSGVQPWSIMGGPYLRKAPCHFGWDWGPMLPPVGIWKDVRLEGRSTARIEDVHLRQRLQEGKGFLEANVRVDRLASAAFQVVVKVTAPDGKTWEQALSMEPAQLRNLASTVTVEIDNPHLWWPNGYGEQPLYGVVVSLKAGQRELDQRSYKIGFRTLELRRQPDEWGESFTFVVNGVPVFAKGADWIPADSFPTRMSDTYIEHLIHSSAEAHMNMLRVWGGGFYEEERFYDLCDRYGIMVWQDFVFACNRYPTDEPFFQNVRVEAIQNVRRLRHRASLALWCGNNEMEQGWSDWGWNKPTDPANQRLKIGYDRMFHHLLPDIVAAEDPDRPYWPSSASSGIPFSEPNGQQRGDCHYWDVWHGRKPFTAYRTQFPRFMSEFGFQSLPPLETIKTYAEEKDWNMTSYIMEHHQRSWKGNGLMIGQMTDLFRMPKDFPMLVYLSMVLQAEGIRYGVEHWRRHKNRVSGILYWQLNDCWPVASWSSIDYFGRWKALHYMARNFFEPVLLSIEDHEAEAQMDVWITIDKPVPWQGKMEWKLVTLSGEILESGKVDASLAPQESKMIFSRVFDLTPEQKRRVVFYCTLTQGSQPASVRLASFAPNKHLDLTYPQLKIVAQQEGSQAVIDLTAQSLARFVELKLSGEDVVFSDNYFDVLPGEAVRVCCPIPEGWSIEQVRNALQVTSLYQSF